MKRFVATTILSLAAATVVVGCDALLGILGPTSVTVLLVNTGDFDVSVELYISDEQDVPSFLITERGDRLDFLVPAGDTVSFAQSCDDMQVIVIEDADLLVLGGAGPEANSDVLRDHDDFSCGDVITFTFAHSDAILDFDVTHGVTP